MRTGGVRIIGVGLGAWALVWAGWWHWGNRPRQPEFKSDRHPVRQAVRWSDRDWRRLPLEERVELNLPEDLLDFLWRDNAQQGWPNRPHPVGDPEFVKSALFSILRELPAGVRARVEPNLVGVYVVADLGGTGYSESVLDTNGDPVAGFVVLDELALRKTANEWATWKERSPFALEGTNQDLKAVIADSANDEPRYALRFILLHEFGHIAALNSDVHPRWDRWVTTERDLGAFPFAALSWTVREGKPASRFDERFPERKDLRFYRGGLRADLAGVYGHLAETDFPTLYAATSPYDDFAESFASYVTVVLFGQPYFVDVYHDSKPVLRFPGCWGSARCRTKEEMLKRFFSTGRTSR